MKITFEEAPKRVRIVTYEKGEEIPVWVDPWLEEEKYPGVYTEFWTGRNGVEMEDKIGIIKMLRRVSGLGLKEAKEQVEKLMEPRVKIHWVFVTHKLES